MTLKQKFIFKLSLCLGGAFLVSELLTKFVFYPTAPVTQLSFRIWLAHKKQQIATLPEKFRQKPTLPVPQLPPPIIYPPPTVPPPTKTPYPKQPAPSPKFTPKPTPTPRKSPPPTPSVFPSPTPPPSTPRPTPPPDIENEVIEVVRLINEERAKLGLKSLDTPQLLMQAAQVYIEDLGPYLYPNNKCEHGVPGKGLMWDYAKRLGYHGQPVGEVVHCGARTPQEAVNGWMNSPPHKACIMSPSGSAIGVGAWHATGDSWGRVYWVGGVEGWAGG